VDEAKRRRLFGAGSRATYVLQTVESAEGKQLRIRATPALTDGDAAKRPLRIGQTKVPGIIATKGTEYTAYIDGDVTVNVGRLP